MTFIAYVLAEVVSEEVVELFVPVNGSEVSEEVVDVEVPVLVDVLVSVVPLVVVEEDVPVSVVPLEVAAITVISPEIDITVLSTCQE